MKIAQQLEQVGQRKLPSRTVRETLAQLYGEIYSETLLVSDPALVYHQLLKTKESETVPATTAYRKGTINFSHSLEMLQTLT